MADLALDDATLDQVAEGIANNIECIRGALGVPVGQAGRAATLDRAWGSEPTEHFVDCVRCRRLTLHKSAAEADKWYERDAREAPFVEHRST